MLTLGVSLPLNKYRDPRQTQSFVADVTLPMSGSEGRRPLRVERQPPEPVQEWNTRFRAVTANYFRTLGISPTGRALFYQPGLGRRCPSGHHQ